MFTLLDEEKAKRFWEEEVRQEGRAEGKAEGENKLGSLITRLNALGRNEDVIRAATDANYRRKHYQEFKMT